MLSWIYKSDMDGKDHLLMLGVGFDPGFRKIPWRKEGSPTQCSGHMENSMDYANHEISKELDRTEQRWLSLSENIWACDEDDWNQKWRCSFSGQIRMIGKKLKSWFWHICQNTAQRVFLNGIGYFEIIICWFWVLGEAG